ncbi:MAG: tetratricopeptide repeat protein [bacterium]
MAIKIKKKSNDPQSEIEEGSEEASEYGTPELVDDHEDIEVVIPQYASKKVNALEDPKVLATIGIVAIVVSLGGYYGYKFMQQKKVDESAVLNTAFTAAWKYTEDGPEVKAFAQRENPVKFETFPTSTEKAQAVYDAANTALGSASAELSVPAKLLKAGAAVDLEKYDEAITLYNDVLKSPQTAYELVPVRQGLSDAHAAKGEWDKAIEQVDAISTVDPKLAKTMKYRKARLLERAGKTKEAKDLYHEIVETDPETPFKSDIERRLATL